MTIRTCFFITSVKKYYLLCIAAATLSTGLISYVIISNALMKDEFFVTNSAVATENSEFISSRDLFSNSELHTKMLKAKVERLTRKVRRFKSVVLNSKSSGGSPNYNVHTFYYAWYGNPEVDGQYKHWNHKYLPNWKQDDSKLYPKGSHNPPDDIGSNFFPLLGCYSSRDLSVIDTHMRQIRGAGIGVVVVSWAPSNFTDSSQDILPTIFDTALKYDVKVTIHVEPYIGRNPINLFDHLKQFFKEFGQHPALYRIQKPLSRRNVPIIYIYDSYLTPAIAWKEILGGKGNLSIRGTNLDAVYLGLVADIQHRSHIRKSQFDGFYTYFATNSFTYGSTWKNWRSLSKFSAQSGLIFVPSVGPGYVDTRVSPWNSANTRHRRHGQYYDVAWRSALNINVNYISITSFNEWHEGTQIEPAVARSKSLFSYLDYEPDGPDFYLNLTRWWVEQFGKTKNLK